MDTTTVLIEKASFAKNENGEEVRRRKESLAINYSNLDADKVLTAFGTFGRYQMLTYIITNFVHVIFSVNMMVMPFITETPKFDCEITEPDGFSWDYMKIDNCTVLDCNNWTIHCNNIPDAKYVFDVEPNQKTLVSEFDLVCEKASMVDHGSSVFMLGTMVGAPFITQLSDLFGRRLTFLIPLHVSCIANLICAVAPTYTIFLAFRFIGGIAAAGFASIGFILCIESVSTEFRDFIPILGNFMWLVGYMLAGVLSMFIRDWRWLYFAISIPGIITLPFYWFVPESLHWLITKGNTRAVRKYIRTSSRFNRSHIVLSECQSGTNLESKSEQSKRTVIDIFRNIPLLMHLIITSYIFTTMNGTYWALSLFSTDLSSNKMLGFFLSGLVEFPAAIVALFVMKYFQRRWVAFFSLFVQAVSLLCAVYIPLSQNALIIFPLIAKSANVIIWSVFPLLCIESVPTTIRNVFSGSATLIGEIGSVTAPYIKHLEAINSNAPFLLIAALSMSSAIFTLTMPETKDQKLPEDIDDYKVGPFWNKIFISKTSTSQLHSNLVEKSSLVQMEQESEENREHNPISNPIQQASSSKVTFE